MVEFSSSYIIYTLYMCFLIYIMKGVYNNSYTLSTPIIIIIIFSCWQHGYPWPSLATPPYRSSP